MPSLPRRNIRLTGKRWRILVEGDERAAPLVAVASLLAFLTLPAMVWLALSKRRWLDAALIAFIVGTQFFYAWAALGVEGFE